MATYDLAGDVPLLAFAKMEGAGNDFVVLDGFQPLPEVAALAPRLCDRHFGIGADGVLVMLPSSRGTVRMRMFNPDGTEDECGNGLRCLALFAVQEGRAPAGAFLLESLSGLKKVDVSAEGHRGRVSVHMGPADLRPASLPADFPGSDALHRTLEVDGETLEVDALSTGTPHTVIFGIPDEARFRRLSPLIERHPLFPERTSVMWADVVSSEEVRVRIWERAAGETLACGTGACAVAVASYLRGYTGRKVRVASRGGVLEITVEENLELIKTGPARRVANGIWVPTGSERPWEGATSAAVTSGHSDVR